MYSGPCRWTRLLGRLRLSRIFIDKRAFLAAFALLMPLPAFLISMNIGTYPLSGPELAEIIFFRLMGHSHDLPPVYDTVVFSIRLPRVLLAMLAGAALSISGATLQGIFRNPLVSPFILGLSSGAAFGAALAMSVFPWMPLQIGAFSFSLLAVGSAYLMARHKGEVPVISLVLAGVVVSSVFGALLAIIQFAVDARSLQSIVYWNMGTLSTAFWSKVDLAAPWVLIGGLIIISLRWRLNVMALGEEEARSVGMNLERYKVVFIVTATLVASAVVAVAGIIGLVGLIVPHMVRMVFGPDHRTLIPLSLTLGASFLVLVDDVARAAFSFEVPVGIITTLLGAPVFIYLLRATRPEVGNDSRRWNKNEDISMAYARSKVLDKVSLTIGKGSVVTIVGPNGCGKTTLLKIINNLIQPDHGRVLVDGCPVGSLPAHRLARIMGYVPQGHKMSFPFKVRDVVITGRMPYIPAFSSPSREDEERTEQVLALTGISGLADQPYTQISGGERQLVMIARAMVQQPSVLLLDEPTSYLDFKNQISTLKMIKEISKRQKVTVMMTLHDPNHALMFSDDVALLRKLNCGREGNLVAFGPPEKVITPKNILKAYGVEVEIMEMKGRKIQMPL